MRWYTTEDLGSKRSLTPEGFLLCREVPIARTGLQMYADGETPIRAAGDGFVRVDRLPEEVFRPETVASIQGKPLCWDHPTENVTPENWRKLAIGVVIDPRRGDGVNDDLLLADLLVTDPSAIESINRNERRQISAGYDAEYEETEPGRARQYNIVVNHCALVDQARCGPRCAIQDEMPRVILLRRRPMTNHVHLYL